jgi:hypothetical protein
LFFFLAFFSSLFLLSAAFHLPSYTAYYIFPAFFCLLSDSVKL